MFNRQQKEREIRHKIKKGDLADIPKDVLETMAPSLLMPSKGVFGNLFIVLQFCLNGFHTRRTNHKLNLTYELTLIDLVLQIFKCKIIVEICFVKGLHVHAGHTILGYVVYFLNYEFSTSNWQSESVSFVK